MVARLFTTVIAPPAFLFAAFAGDASVGTFFPDNSALLRVGTCDDDFHNIGHKIDQMVRTCLRTQPAAGTFACVDVRNAIFDADRVTGTDADAVAKTHTAEGTLPFPPNSNFAAAQLSMP
jgi:hypothetical protein